MRSHSIYGVGANPAEQQGGPKVLDRLFNSWPDGLVVKRRALTLKESFEDLASRFARDEGTVVLLSGGELDSARYHMLATMPWLTLSGYGQAMTLSAGGRQERFTADPFDALRALSRRFALEGGQGWGPVASGLFGYLAYDLKDAVEKLPRTTLDRRKLPQLWFTAPRALVVKDRRTGEVSLWVTGESEAALHRTEQAFTERLAGPLPAPGRFGGDGGFVSNFDMPGYMAAIERVKEYIRAGDIYQVNMSQRFEGGFSGDPYALFTELFAANPAPFFAYVQAGSHQIVSTSPERFLKLDHRSVEARPIKGTRPRGKTPHEDDALRHELETSPKDDAELSMIVDLMRNDIGKVCRAGSVAVTQHKGVEAYKNVFHLVSIVEGQLDEATDGVDLLRATFPGGSITGCPKIRSMEIIDELETDRRHIYTGSIGYVSFHDTMDLSIAIRTATVSDGRVTFSVGGGVVYDSDPEAEYHETLHKGETLMNAFTGSPSARGPEERVWLDGRLAPATAAGLPVMSRAVQYGAGVFETLRVEKGQAPFLAHHLARLNKSWSGLFGGALPDLTWEPIISRVVEANGLADRTAAVKIMVGEGRGEGLAFGGHVAVTARPYTHRLKVLDKPGLSLVSFPSPRTSALADHKSFNYLLSLKALAYAGEMGADEALLMNGDETVSELATANLLALSGDRVILPASPHVLPGVMQSLVLPVLESWGYTVAREPLGAADLLAMDGVMATNALMGAVPVLEVDGKAIKGMVTGLCADLNAELGIR
ncbi:aminodeoxychorismate synthase component I [Desulfoluna spongiiphila]|uniref:aminodeoxychorismate synthase component I n=1 Tax=Desulfoluna spongiiphila TaxID=419481 RepID=UPI00125C4B0E|nr:aminodeoxychorismate synthase component I [Desulfoluna spongiiphila]VVS93120.1 adc synthase [Desulfoluna spongiiphila]